MLAVRNGAKVAFSALAGLTTDPKPGQAGIKKEKTAR